MSYRFTLQPISFTVDWAEAYSNLREALGIETDDPIPKLQRPQQINTVDRAIDETPPPKRKHTNEDVDMSTDPPASDDSSKRPKLDGTKSPGQAEAAVTHARMAASFIPFLTEEMLRPPKMPTHDEMEQVLLDLRKKALVEEYFGNEDA
jgi:pre-mRNA-splicing factor ISY1